MKRAFLGELEEVVLLTVAALQEQAYCASITQTIDQQMARTISFPTVHTTSATAGGEGLRLFSDGRSYCRAGWAPETPVYRHGGWTTGIDRVSASSSPIVGADSNPNPSAMGRLTDRHYAGPPRWAVWLLSRFSPPGLEDELQGDMMEMYTYWVKTVGLRGARWRYEIAVLRLIRPFTWPSTRQSHDYSQPEPHRNAVGGPTGSPLVYIRQ
jgi:hypothetical protein